MLVLSRKAGEKLVIDNQIVITVQRITGNRVSLGIEAPRDVHIARGELQPVPETVEFELPLRDHSLAVGTVRDGFTDPDASAAAKPQRVGRSHAR